MRPPKARSTPPQKARITPTQKVRSTPPQKARSTPPQKARSTPPQKTRITLNETELTLIKPGLDLVVKSQALALENADQLPKSEKKGYNKAFSRMLRELRTKMAANSRRTLLLDAIQLSALAFAFRKGRKQLRHKSAKAGKQNRKLEQAKEDLEVKLENARKCAKRQAISRSGKLAYDKRQRKWRAFQDWLRAAIRSSQRREPRRTVTAVLQEPVKEPVVIQSPERLRSTAFFELTREVIGRCTNLQLSENQLRHLVKRMKNALQRSPLHHELDIEQAIADPKRAQEFILKFIRYKTPYLTMIKLEYADLSTQESTRATEFRRALEAPEDPTAEVQGCKRNGGADAEKQAAPTSQVSASVTDAGVSGATDSPEYSKGEDTHRPSLHPQPQQSSAKASGSTPIAAVTPAASVKTPSKDALRKTATDIEPCLPSSEKLHTETLAVPGHPKEAPAPEEPVNTGGMNPVQTFRSEPTSEADSTTEVPSLVSVEKSETQDEKVRRSPQDQYNFAETITKGITDWLEREIKKNSRPYEVSDRCYEVMDQVQLIVKRLPQSWEPKDSNPLQKLTFEQVLANNRPTPTSELIPGQASYFAHCIVSSLMAVCKTRNQVRGFLHSALEAMKWRRPEEALREMRGNILC